MNDPTTGTKNNKVWSVAMLLIGAAMLLLAIFLRGDSGVRFLLFASTAELLCWSWFLRRDI